MGDARHEGMGRRGERVERSSGAAPPRQSGGKTETGARAGQLLDVEIGRSEEDACVISVVGELDLNTLPILERLLLPELATDGGVILDLTELIFIDSSGIGLLIEAFRTTGNGRRMHTVIAPDSQVERVFELAGIGRALPLFTSRNDALAALHKGGSGEAAIAAG
jgi:anti-sigma B factor antagonist